MLVRLVRWICHATVRLFFSQIRVVGRDAIPEDGATLVVANHPNGLMDPVLIQIALRRDVGFLAKSSLFENPVGLLAMRAFSAVPVYRAKDGQDTSRNATMFAACHERLAGGDSLVVFPEGISHSEPMLQPLKTGAARIALSAEDDAPTGLKILPVGLIYEDKTRFLSRVAVRIGQPIPVEPYLETYRDEPREATRRLTQDIAAALGDVVLQADSSELWRGFLAVARWTDDDAARDVAAAEARARFLANGWRRMLAEEPERAEELVEETRHFVRMLESVGVEDPLELEREDRPSLRRFLLRDLGLLLAAPFAAVGFALIALPYFLIGPIARRVSGADTDLVSTIKALGGLLFFPLTYFAEALLVGWAFGFWWGLVVLTAGPVTGWLAMWFAERFALRREALRAYWVKLTRTHLAQAVRDRRRELSRKIEEGLATYAAGS